MIFHLRQLWLEYQQSKPDCQEQDEGDGGASEQDGGDGGASEQDGGINGATEQDEGVVGASEQDEGAGGATEQDEGVVGASEQDEGAGGATEQDEGVVGASEQDDGAGGATEQDEGVVGASEQDEGVVGASEQDGGAGGASEQDGGDGGATEQDGGTNGATEQDGGVVRASEQDEGAGGATEQDEGVVGASEQDEGAGGATEQDEGVVGASEQDDGAGGATEQDEGVVGASEQDEGAGGATEQDEGVVGASEQDDGAGGATEQDEGVVGASEQDGGAGGASEQDGGDGGAIEQDGGTNGATEQDGGVVRASEQDGGASGATEQDGGATEQDGGASGATEQDGGATEQDGGDGGATEQDGGASGATEQDGGDGGATEQDEGASGATEQDEGAVGTSEQEDAVTELTNMVIIHKRICTNKEQREIFLQAQDLAKQLYDRNSLRYPEIIWQLSKDLELAEVTMKVYVTHFNCTSLSVNESLRLVLRVFWPEDNRALQDLLLTYFSRWYLLCKRQPVTFQPTIYNLYWSMIILNADLNGRHKGRKMTQKEFTVNLNRAQCRYRYCKDCLKKIYTSIKMNPLEAYAVRATCPTAGKNETSTPPADNNPTTTVHKTGNLICKKVMDENGRETRKGQRSWTPYIAVLQGMVLYLQRDASDICNTNGNNAIRLHHAMAYPADYRKRPNVLCLRTADSRLFYFQAESEVEQTLWIETINLIAARYSAPPLTSASHSITEHHPQVLPSYPTLLSTEQQLKHHEHQLQRVSEHLLYYMSLPFGDTFDSVMEEKKRYTTYVEALRQLISRT
ncbi:PH and SEC7 domain-containing protein 1-like [Neoarius graeffei]|uniref:PH and SEC7 domain-containing protein 1-like n=1 Tax=Neoarius graeffei TaxID=443677 RepID=UPI00298BEF7C|nr:PH and SEC7 domain-containing protein 1-like [Neoarius graeffei]